MYEFLYNVLKPSLKDLMLHYIDADNFVLNFTESSVPDKYMDLSNFDTQLKLIIKFQVNLNMNLEVKS